jgi:hypothetical protein
MHVIGRIRDWQNVMEQCVKFLICCKYTDSEKSDIFIYSSSSQNRAVFLIFFSLINTSE